MEPTTEVSKQIKDLIDAYYSESSAEPLYLKRLVEEYHLLPILIDWAGFFGLRSDGEIFMISTDDEIVVQVESDPRIRRIAVFQGAKRFPILKSLIPTRPSNAIDCHHCEGRGSIDFPGIEPDMIVCYCGGLGWLTEEDIVGEPLA